MRRRLLLATPAIVLASSSLMLPWRARGQALPDQPWVAERVPNRVVVRFKPGGTPDSGGISTILGRHHAKLEKTFNGDVYVFDVPVAKDAKPLAQELTESGLVRYAEPDAIEHGPPPTTTPNDPHYTNNDQAYLANINCPTVWSTLQLANVTLGSMPPCVDVNTGVQTNHPDLQANITATFDASGDGIADTIGHGTECIGFMGAVTNNSAGVASVGWGGSIIAVKIWHNNVTTSGTLLESGLQWIISNVSPPAFVNLSLNMSSPLTTTMQTTFPSMYKNGYFFTLATGDSGFHDCRNGLSQNDFLLTVTSCNGGGASPFAKPAYPNYGPPADGSGVNNGVGTGALIATPGGPNTGSPAGLATTAIGSTYITNTSGTSFSAPIASAMARYLKVAVPSLHNQDIWYILTNSANGHATTGFTSVSAPWLNPPCPLMDLCLTAAQNLQRSPWGGKRGKV